jgi:hypothetical protein
MQNVFASSLETKKPQTLLEMHAEKQELEKQEDVLQFKWNTFRLWNDTLEDIVKLNLTNLEKQNLEEIITTYLKSEKKLENKLNNSIKSGKEIENIKLRLRDWKHSFYKELIPYIQIIKLEAFKNYVNSDLNYNEKSKDIQSKIEQKDVEQENRLEELYYNRDDSARDLRKNIEASITLKVTPKIDAFVAKKWFLELSNDLKIEVFLNIVNKFEFAIEELENTQNPTRALEERIIWLEVVVDILDTYIGSWK